MGFVVLIALLAGQLNFEGQTQFLQWWSEVQLVRYCTSTVYPELKLCISNPADPTGKKSLILKPPNPHNPTMEAEL